MTVWTSKVEIKLYKEHVNTGICFTESAQKQFTSVHKYATEMAGYLGMLLKCITEHKLSKPVCLSPDVLRIELVGLHQVQNTKYKMHNAKT